MNLCCMNLCCMHLCYIFERTLLRPFIRGVDSMTVLARALRPTPPGSCEWLKGETSLMAPSCRNVPTPRSCIFCC